jgi:esterase/lipase
LSARLLLDPKVVGDRVFFLSDFSGVLSLYSMDKKGSIPRPLLPGGQALVNPHLMDGHNFYVLPKLGKVLVMMDKQGNENYQPMLIPLDGGIPQNALGDRYRDEKLSCVECDTENNIAYFARDDRKRPENECLRVDLSTGTVISLGESIYGNRCNGVNSDHSKVILADGYTAGDVVLFYWETGQKDRKQLYGTSLNERNGKQVAASGIDWCSFTQKDEGLLFVSAIFHDTGGLTFLGFNNPSKPIDVQVRGLKHSGTGELVTSRKIKDNLFVLTYNIDGVSWVYEGTFKTGGNPTFEITRTLCGLGALSSGVIQGIDWQTSNGSTDNVEYVLSFTKANSPSQLYLYPPGVGSAIRLSDERVLGIPPDYLAAGEDASFTTWDGLRVSARLYLPSPKLGYKGPRPLVEYVHGGPQGQERPDFTWFSMPLIQYLTLKGFAVFVPNVRGSTGYGMRYTKLVDRDWGGNDVKDHLEGLKHLEKDSRIDSTRRAVVGRSYGGFMTLTLASRFPKMWKAAVDMFGPYDLPKWASRVPPSWMPYIKLAVGDPEKDRDMLLDHSPKTYLANLQSPLMIIQGKNDPRVPEPESAQVVDDLRRQGAQVEYLVFEDEGHDVLRFKNRVTCYSKITDFFLKHLGS